MSVNFGFLAEHDGVLVHHAAQAEGLFRPNPRLCVVQLRTFAEALAKQSAAYAGVYLQDREELAFLLGRLRDRGILDAQIFALFRTLREGGNDAVHVSSPDRPARSFTHSEALKMLRIARELAVWFHRSFGVPQYKAGPFVPPPDPPPPPVDFPDADVTEELNRLRAEVVRLSEVSASAAEHARLRREAEARAAQAYADVEAALALATEASERLEAEKAQFLEKLAAIQSASTASSPENREILIRNVQSATRRFELDEQATRALIDAQLREAGWEADSSSIRYARGARPVKGRNLAIAEWPTSSGPADYALFSGLTLLAVVEAKKISVDVMGALAQARRYARSIRLEGGAVLPGGPWGEDKLPFIFATNGRPFLQQHRTLSGIWFRDLRRPQNPELPLVAWKTPQGLLEALNTDIDAAHAALRAEPTDLLGLRPYQVEAIRAVEKGIEEGQRALLVAMATGTGKTRTCVGLIYRLIKTRRFSRVLFLVDRTSLGEQAAEAFITEKVEDLRSFADIYGVKTLEDLRADPETRLHFATVQGMVRRLLTAEAGEALLPVDSYDCIIVDESHRGYTLDRDMSDLELSFRSEQDYISKYRRVLDYFDAVRIGLTATPALHTVQIFGNPIYTYSYREAVVDGYLVDHEPPYILSTRLAREGINIAADSKVQAYDPTSGQIHLFQMPDTVDFSVEDFNRQVITEPFNRAVVQLLSDDLSPLSPGKTLVFAVDNAHADLLVQLFREAWRQRYPEDFTDDHVQKITSAIDRPAQAIRNYKNEPRPNVVVTVDLLTTGIDVPRIVNLVFIRSVNSRILYDQMRGRATRLCPEIGKEYFRIYDAVDLYARLKDHTDMKPVVTRPHISLAELVAELAQVPSPEARALVLDQIITRLRQRKGRIQGENRESFLQVAGAEPEAILEHLSKGGPEQALAFFAARPDLVAWMDRKLPYRPPIPIWEEEDQPDPITQDFSGLSAEDYLESFRSFLATHRNEIPALLLVTTRPRDLTRKQLRELRLALDNAGYSERHLQAAYQQQTNQEIAASIIGYVRRQALGDPLLPYTERVERACNRLLASRTWTRTQRDWLEKIKKQICVEGVVDREALDQGAFTSLGGSKVAERVFDGRLNDVLAELHDGIWKATA